MSEPTDVVYQRQGEREFLARVYQPDGSGRQLDQHFNRDWPAARWCAQTCPASW